MIVVGSGASGGWAAKRLSEAGLEVAVLEAGRRHTPADFTEHRPEFELSIATARPNSSARRGHAEGLLRLQRVQLRLVRQRYRGALHDAGGQALQLAGTHAPRRRPHQRLGPAELPLQRPRLQGRVLRRVRRWTGRSATRTSAPYYDLVEDYVGITGIAEGVDRAARRPLPAADGDDLRGDASPQPREGQARVDDHHRPRRQHHQALNGRSPCHYCGPCERGCVTHSYFNAAFTTVADALKTGKCTLITERDGLQGADRSRAHRRAASSTSTASRASRRRSAARVVVLCAQALESARILLNSATGRIAAASATRAACSATT